MRPNFEEPLDTGKQLVEQNITLYLHAQLGFEEWRQFFLESSIPEYNILGETMIMPDDWDHFNNITEHDVIGAGTHAQMTGALDPYELAMGKWHRSKEKLAGDHPYAGYLTDKKWHLNEESTDNCKPVEQTLQPAGCRVCSTGLQFPVDV